MAITDQYQDREYKKFVESVAVAGLPAIAVVNPDGTNISGGGGGGGSQQYTDGAALTGVSLGTISMGSDGSNAYFLDSDNTGKLNLNNISGTISLPTGAATESTLANIETNTNSLSTITNTTVGAKTGLDVNIIEGINVEVDLDQADDSVQVYGNDGTTNRAIRTDENGRLQVDVLSNQELDKLQTDYFQNLVVAKQYNQVELRLDKSDYADYLDTTATGGAADNQLAGVVTWNSGTNPVGSIVSTSTLNLDYRPGYGLFAAGTAVFNPGVVGNNRRIGISDDTSFNNSVTIGYEGTDFKIRYTRGGSEIVSVAQADWDDPCLGASGSRYTRDGSPEPLLPTSANLYRIKAGLFGFAGWVVEVFTPDEEWIPVYTYKNINSGTDPVFESNTFKIIFHNVNSTSTTDSTITSQCWAAGTSSDLLRLDDSLTDDSLASLNRSVITGRKSTNDGTYVNVKVNPSGSLEVNANQDTHDNLNANVNLQVGDTDVDAANPVPVDVVANTIGLATQATLADVETNTDSLAGVTQTTVGSDQALDVNVSNTVNALVQPTLIGRLYTQQDQGTGNINLPINTGTVIKVLSVNLHFAVVPTAADFTIQVQDLANPVYNTTIFKVNPGSLNITDVSWYPDGELIIPASQMLQFDFNNISTTQYGLTVVYEQIN